VKDGEKLFRKVRKREKKRRKRKSEIV